jgi:Domain of unknown function (DUF1905)
MLSLTRLACWRKLVHSLLMFDDLFELAAFTAPVWIWTSQSGSVASWHFVTLPPETAATIRGLIGKGRPGFGSVRVTAQIEECRWSTSIFPHNDSNSYLLPLKAAVRRQVHVKAGDVVTVHLSMAL